jgi:5,10-methylenetetrahydromethanopterin reductase
MDWSWTSSPGVALLAPGAAAHAPAWARAAERAGLGSAWIIEDYFHPGAFALAGAVAAATERIAVGLGVVNPYTRHPALLAMETGALAGLAPGRVVLGLGTSNRNWIEEQMGIPFATPLTALGECVTVVRRLLGGERVSFRGERFHLERVALEAPAPAPVPILLGVKGPRALALAGRVADGVHCAVLASPAHVRRVRATAGAGRARRLVVIAYVPVVVDRDGRAAREAVKPLLARYAGVLHGQSILEDAGLGPARTLPFREALGRSESAAHLVTDDMIDALAVAGTPDECRDRLRRWADAGLDAPVAVLPPGVDVGEHIARIGAELAPAWPPARAT